ncbi:MAG: LysR family transcriptional regulator [Tannerella sp.]|jgi:molybdate transport system regulatory protein|nr:LysR family transcriptional regulator [Tannerella sp.]
MARFMLSFPQRNKRKEMYQPFKITAELEIRKHGFCFLNPKRIRLLKHIQTGGSILAASKELRMSYQQAWTTVRDINSTASLPVVTRQRGGANGGGAAVTPFGLKLIERFDLMQAKHDTYLKELEDELDICV